MSLVDNSYNNITSTNLINQYTYTNMSNELVKISYNCGYRTVPIYVRQDIADGFVAAKTKLSPDEFANLFEVIKSHSNIIHEDFIENEMEIEQEIARFERELVFGKEAHTDLYCIWTSLYNWKAYFANKPVLEIQRKKVNAIIEKIRSDNKKTDEYFFGVKTDEFIDKILLENKKGNKHYYSDQIYDLSYSFDLFFNLSSLDDSQLLAKYFGFINENICYILRCQKGTKYSSRLNEYQLQKINKKLNNYKFKKQIVNWFSSFTS